MTKTEVILISQFPLPYPKTGSWTTMYSYFIQHFNHNIDYIICNKEHNQNQTIKYQYLKKTGIIDKVKNKLISGNRYSNYTNAINKIIKPDCKYIIQIIDNKGLVSPLHQFLSNKHKRENFCVQYFYHGFIFNFKTTNATPFFKSIDELFLLTERSRLECSETYKLTDIVVKVLHNGVNSRLFKTVSSEKKLELRRNNNLNEELVFLWCSQDRPKKGLELALVAFGKVHAKNENTRLLLVGVNKNIEQSGVTVMGKVPNKDLAIYYQMSDVFLFTTMCEEGFGLVLAEALKCGCYCIASNLGGVPEVLNFGRYGVVLNEPYSVEQWVLAMQEAVGMLRIKQENPYLKNIPKNIYNLEDWCEKMNVFIQQSKAHLTKTGH